MFVFEKRLGRGQDPASRCGRFRENKGENPMKRSKKLGLLFCVFVGTLVLIGSSPMPLFAMIEGGGGGGGGGGGTFPKTWESPCLVSSSGSWTTPVKKAYAMIETEDAIVSVEVMVTYYSKYWNEAKIHVSGAYTYKDTRHNVAADNDGALDYFKIEIRKIGSYDNYIEGMWQLGNLDRGAFPEAFTCYQVPSNPWETVTSTIVTETIEGAIMRAIQGGGAFASLGAAIFANMVMDYLEMMNTNTPDHAWSGSDTSGYAIWDNIDVTQKTNYHESLPYASNGWSFAYDITTYNEIEFQYTSSVPYGRWIGLEFRGKAVYEDIAGPGWHTTVYTPWVNLWFVA
jgi:hypothetical protein